MFFVDKQMQCQHCKGKGIVDTFEFKNLKMALLFWFIVLCVLVVITLFSLWLNKTYGHLPDQLVSWLDLKLKAYMGIP